MGERDEANTMRVLLVTDTHLGFQEDDEELGEDSYAALQEALEIARASRADFVLHSGDMFHNNRPSRQCLYRAITILRERCVGDGEVRFAVCSRAGARVRVPVAGAGTGTAAGTGATREVDTCAPPRPNFEDPNFNIDLPVWAIHGNHDDPSGPGPAGELAALDVLAAANLVNYFGKVPRQDEITVTPIIMQKGTTRVALYGLGSVKDERLCDTFEKGRVRFLTPEHAEGYFNILALHQNRAARGTHAFVPDACLPSFLNLVVWGHEHDCRIEPEPAASGKPFHITQPGSTVTVALSKEELAQKHVGLLAITGTSYTLTPIPLRTTRPFIMDTVSLADMLPPRASEQRVTEALLRHVNKMIRERLPPGAAADSPQDQQQHRRLPLVRLRVEGTGYDTPHPQRFGQELVGRVANPGEVLRVMRRGAKSGDGAGTSADSTGTGGGGSDDDDDDASVFAAEFSASGTVDAFLDDYFARPDKLGLRILNPSDMFDRIKHCRPADVKDTVQQCIETLMSETRARLQGSRRVVDRESILEELGAAARARALMAQAPPGGPEASGAQPAVRSRDTASEILREIDAGRVPVIGSDVGDCGDNGDGDGDGGDAASGRRAGRSTPSRGRGAAAAGRRTPAARRGAAAVAVSTAPARSTQSTQKSQTRIAASLLDELSSMSSGTPSQFSCPPPPKKTRTSNTSTQHRGPLKLESQPRRASDPVVIDDDDDDDDDDGGDGGRKNRGGQDKKGEAVLVLDDDSDGDGDGDDFVPRSVPGTQQQHTGFAVPQAVARQSPSGVSSAPWSQSAKQSQMYDQWGQ